MHRYRGFLTVSIVFLLGFSTARAADYGSVYSLRGWGLTRFTAGPRAAGMGGVSLATISSRYLNNHNPAQFGALLDVRTTASFFSQRLGVSAKEGFFRSYYSNFNSVAAGFPIKRNVGVQFGIVPETISGFRLESKFSLNNFSYTKSIEKKGGLNTFYFGVGAKILPGFYLGSRVDFLFGKIVEKWALDFENPSFDDGKNTFSTKAWGLNIGVGTVVQPTSWLSVGASFWPSRRMRMQSEKKYYRPQITETVSKNWTYPAKYGGGIAVTLGKKWLMGLDYWTEQWSKFRIEGAANSEMSDENRISVGIEMSGSRDRYASFLKKISLRAGYYTHELNVLGFKGNDKVTENVGTFGLGFPFDRGMGSIDFAIEAGTRGKTSVNLYKESIFRFILFVTGGEHWFVRHKK
ncbi:hypothetical protein BMS3Abin05_02578 [bacterium BMS3Abin05]|nr:hypothetical protein BMS3Abin05_02578 [bacterium BMS3Abin05]GBE28069.1 hypothetical protein BMS3Bbin03_02005 [bacterium BMS3Bbin03]